jgi:hypothetical protein
VQAVLSVGRSVVDQTNAKLTQLVHADMFNYSAIESELTGYDACFFCLGITSAGLSEAQYSRTTYDMTIAAAQTLARLNPQMTFIYVSGKSTDSSEQGRVMWARIKGKTENALLKLPFKAAYMFRPGAIQPLHGIKSKTGWYQTMYVAMKPLFPLLKMVFPDAITTTEQVGRAMIKVAREGYSKKVLETTDISRV